MCPAPRKPQNRGLERNLHVHPSKGFRWKHPQTGRYHYFGKLDPETGAPITRERANQTARALNLRFAPKTSIYDRVVGDASTSMSALVELHRTEVLAKRDLAAKTRETYDYYLGQIKNRVGSWDITSLTSFDVAQFLKTATDGDRARQLIRQQLIELFQTAIQEGLRHDNPAALTRRPVAKRRRMRLTEEGYRAVYEKAAPWLRNAMDLGLLTLQRREDLVSLRWEADDGTQLKIEQKKTGKRLGIAIGPELRALLDRCRDDVRSPFVIHRRPVRLRPTDRRAAARDHHTQVLPEQLTRAFERARALSGHYAEVGEGSTPPSFHEIRSLGIALYRKAGWPESRIQALAGHEDIEQTEHYLKGHEAPWAAVPCGMELPTGSVTEALP